MPNAPGLRGRSWLRNPPRASCCRPDPGIRRYSDRIPSSAPVTRELELSGDRPAVGIEGIQDVSSGLAVGLAVRCHLQRYQAPAIFWRGGYQELVVGPAAILPLLHPPRVGGAVEVLAGPALAEVRIV